jgi:lipoprotein-releasing system permease protein
MYKLLLSWRYLKTRYIALASIISVTLGVATLIVVNSVMAGFTREMHSRLHAILSDLVFESSGLDGFPDPDWHMQQIRDVLGPDLAGMTPVVHVPALVRIPVQGEYHTRQINLIGIDSKTYDQVSDFGEYLQHPANRGNLSFVLRDSGYAPEKPDFPASGWRHRQMRVAFERALEEQFQADRFRASQHRMPPLPSAPSTLDTPQVEPATPDVADADSTPVQPSSGSLDATLNSPPTPPHNSSHDPLADPQSSLVPSDPYASTETQPKTFDAMQEQHTGIIMGIAICSLRARDAEGQVRDYYLCRPGDDVEVILPNAGVNLKPVSSFFTVVDLYESKMSEYDSSFAFIPLEAMQDLRGMFDPQTGVASVTSIQIKLRPGVDLNAARDKLRKRFPPDEHTYRIQTWRDMQGPLLAAVSLETTILNILLFLIIAVAGFGILATFFMIVVEKTRDIGILKALGAPSTGVMSIFLTYGISLGAVGSGVGMIIGLLFVHYINQIADGIEYITGQEVFDQTIYYFQSIPTEVSPWMVVWVVVGAVLIAVLASVLPALRAARLHPVEALRYE